MGAPISEVMALMGRTNCVPGSWVRMSHRSISAAPDSIVAGKSILLLAVP